MNSKRSSYKGVTYKVVLAEVIKLNSPLFIFFPTTYYHISKRCMESQDFDFTKGLFSYSTLRRLDRRKKHVLRTNSTYKERGNLPRYNLDRKERSQMNGYKGPRKFCDYKTHHTITQNLRDILGWCVL